MHKEDERLDAIYLQIHKCSKYVNEKEKRVFVKGCYVMTNKNHIIQNIYIFWVHVWLQICLRENQNFRIFKKYRVNRRGARKTRHNCQLVSDWSQLTKFMTFFIFTWNLLKLSLNCSSHFSASIKTNLISGWTSHLKWLCNIVEGWWKHFSNFCMKCYLLYSFYCTNPRTCKKSWKNLKPQRNLWFSLKGSLCDTL